MRKLYYGHIDPTFPGESDMLETMQKRAREALERVLDRAAVEFASPVQPVSISTQKYEGCTALLVLVEEDPSGFKPLGT